MYFGLFELPAGGSGKPPGLTAGNQLSVSYRARWETLGMLLDYYDYPRTARSRTSTRYHRSIATQNDPFFRPGIGSE